MDDHPKEDVSPTKRALLKAGWVAPLILAINLPPSGFAANVSGGSNQDGQGGNQDQNSQGGNQK